jgi:DNA polymerase III delta prime subunit
LSSYLPNIILTGSNGSGKASIAQIITQRYFQRPEHQKYAVLTIDGSIFRSKNIISEAPVKKSSEKGVEVPNIINFIKRSLTIPADKQKIVIINDFDCMVDEAQMGLRRIIEKYSAKVRFIFICQHISNIIEAIQSRSTIIKLVPVKHELIVNYLKKISASGRNSDCPFSDQENLVYDNIATIANGDVRCALNMLQLFSGSEPKTLETFYQIFNIPSLEMIKNAINSCKAKKYIEATEIISDVIDNGFNIHDILDIIIKVLSKPDTFNKKTEEHLRIWYIDTTIKCILKTKDCTSSIYLHSLLGEWVAM